MPDRIEVLSRLVVAAVLALAAPASLAVATATAADLRATAQEQAATRTQTLAVLSEDAAIRPDAGTGTGSTTPTDAAWTAPDGTTRQGTVAAPSGLRAGDAVPIWIDEDGARIGAPLLDGDVTAGTVMAGGGTFVLIVAAAVLGHGFVCWTLNRHRDRRWSAGWAAVEPSWSGRLP